MIPFDVFRAFSFYFDLNMAQIWHRPEEHNMVIALNEELLRALAQDDSVTVAEETYEEEIADLFPDEYCDPMGEFKMI